MFNSNRFTCISSIVSILLFINIHFQDWTPLHIASALRYAEIVRLLLLLGADMDIVNAEVRTSTVLCFIFVGYLCSQHAYFISMYKMTSMKKSNNRQYGLLTF